MFLHDTIKITKEVIPMSKIFYPAIFHTDEDGGFWIEFPDLPGCLTEGDTIEESMEMAEEVLELYLYTANEYRKTVSSPSYPTDVKVSGRDFIALIPYDEEKAIFDFIQQDIQEGI